MRIPIHQVVEKDWKRHIASGMRKDPTIEEKVLQEALQKDERFRKVLWTRQYVRSGFICDFYFYETDLVVEVDGPEHSNKTRTIKQDNKKEYVLGRNGCFFLRVKNEDVISNPQLVVDQIYNKLKTLRTKVISSRSRQNIEKHCIKSIV